MTKVAHAAATLLVAVTLAGCAAERYSPHPVDVERNAAEIAAQRLDSPGLREFMRANGHSAAPWPLPEWGLTELSLAAMYFHPELDLARAQWALARSRQVDPQRQPVPALELATEQHSLTEGDRSPWSLGFAFDYALLGVSRREALIEQARLLSDAAKAEVASSAWRVHSRVRASLIDYLAATQEVGLRAELHQARQAMTALQERRRRAGAASGTDVGNARLAENQAQQDLVAARARVGESRAGLARSIGLDAQRIGEVKLRVDSLAARADSNADRVLEIQNLRTAALWNRADVVQALALYGAAEASLRAEIAAQYPDFRIKPGIAWDQDDRVWSFALGFELPLARRNAGPIARAKAQRELEGERLRVLQAGVLAQLDHAHARYSGARLELTAARASIELLQERARRVQDQLAQGYADRADQLGVQLELGGARLHEHQARINLLRAIGLVEDVIERPLGDYPRPPVPYSNPRQVTAR